MKIIHQNGYTVEELALYRLTVYKNLLDCAKALIGAYHYLQLEPSSQKVQDYISFLEEYNVDPDPTCTLAWHVATLQQRRISRISVIMISERSTVFLSMSD